MTQLKIDQIIINNELSIKEKVKLLVSLLMVIHNIKYPSAYYKAKALVDVEWRLK